MLLCNQWIAIKWKIFHDLNISLVAILFKTTKQINPIEHFSFKNTFRTEHWLIVLSSFTQVSQCLSNPEYFKMQLKVVILCLSCFLCVSCSLKISSNETNLLNIFEINSSEKWDKLCPHLVNMMLSSDARSKGTVDVAILFLETVSVNRKYEGFDVKLAKYANGSLVMRKVNSFIPNVLDNGRESFLIFLINDLIPNYQSIIQNYFRRVFLDKSIKIFLIITDFKTRSRILLVWKALILLKYSNVYIIFHENSGEFSIHRTMMERTPKNTLNLFMKESTDQKFLVMKDVVSTSTLPIRIVHYDTYPVSYLKKGSIIGPDGNLIYEFSKKLNTSVQIVNRPSSVPTLNDISYYLDTTAEISIYVKAALYTQNVATVWLNEVEGICLLVPRNIPVSAYEIPMDKPSLILALISTISVIITWMKVTDEMSTSLIALMTLLIENIVYRWKDCWTNYMNNKVTVHIMNTKRRKLKLDAWRKKFISNRRSKNNKQPDMMKSKEENSLIKLISEKNESIKCRESVGGGYFIIEKFKVTNKSRQRRHRIIQVRPIEECSAES